jgi:arsenite-transporting ATPase
VREIGNGYEIKMRLPFLDNANFELKKFGDELVIDLGNRRRNVFLPKFAHFLEVEYHVYESPWLTIWMRKG